MSDDCQSLLKEIARRHSLVVEVLPARPPHLTESNTKKNDFPFAIRSLIGETYSVEGHTFSESKAHGASSGVRATTAHVPKVFGPRTRNKGPRTALRLLCQEHLEPKAQSAHVHTYRIIRVSESQKEPFARSPNYTPTHASSFLKLHKKKNPNSNDAIPLRQHRGNVPGALPQQPRLSAAAEEEETRQLHREAK